MSTLREASQCTNLKLSSIISSPTWTISREAAGCSRATSLTDKPLRVGLEMYMPSKFYNDGIIKSHAAILAILEYLDRSRHTWQHKASVPAFQLLFSACKPAQEVHEVLTLWDRVLSYRCALMEFIIPDAARW